MSPSHIFIHSTNIFEPVPGIVPHTGDVAVSKIDEYPCPHVREERQTINKDIACHGKKIKLKGGKGWEKGLQFKKGKGYTQ